MTPKTPFASIAIDSATRGLSGRHAAPKPATAIVITALGVAGGWSAYGMIGLGIGLLFGISTGIGLWGIGTAVQQLHRIERNTRSDR